MEFRKPEIGPQCISKTSKKGIDNYDIKYKNDKILL